MLRRVFVALRIPEGVALRRVFAPWKGLPSGIALRRVIAPWKGIPSGTPKGAHWKGILGSPAPDFGAPLSWSPSR